MIAFPVNKEKTKRLFVFFSIFLLVLYIARFLQTWQYKNTYGSVDLRNRVIGARITLHEKTTSPYFYKWKQGDGEEYLDPYDSPGMTVNRTTVTPFTLQLIQPFCDYRFQSIAVGWYIAEAIALLLVVLIFYLKANDLLQKFVVLLTGLLFTGCSQGWLLHNINGQVYIFYTLLMSVLFYFSTGNKKLSPIITGIALGVFVLLRPIAIVFILPLLLKKQWKAVGYFVFLLGVYFIQQYYSGEWWLWNDYYKAMSEWAVQLFDSTVKADYIDLNKITVLEGSFAVSPSPYQGLTEDSSLMSMAFRFFHIEMAKTWLMMLSFSFCALLFFIYRNRLLFFDVSRLFMLSFLCYFIIEIFLPAIRNSYNGVQWMFPLLLFVSFNYLNKKILVLLIAGGVLSLGLLKFLPFDLSLAELIFAIIIIYFINTKPVHA